MEMRKKLDIRTRRTGAPYRLLAREDLETKTTRFNDHQIPLF
jgi:hypothetical protein